MSILLHFYNGIATQNKLHPFFTPNLTKSKEITLAHCSIKGAKVRKKRLYETFIFRAN